MGLCKCPKKNVTNQFCFEHRVNVCEHCMVTNHTKCVVQSYLLWLQDSDYDPNCQMCKEELEKQDCIRLTCYHVFHWHCLNRYADNLPPQTAPAGYTCPICSVGIFPPQNMVSPVADVLRNRLIGVHWARCGLAFPLVENVSAVPSGATHRDSPRKVTVKTNEENSYSMDQSVTYANIPKTNQNEGTCNNRPEPFGAAFNSGHFSAPRKMYDSTDSDPFRPTTIDHDEDKYKRRSPFEMFNRWIHSRTLLSRNRRRDSSTVYKRWVVVGMLALIGLCTLIIIFLRMGRSSADSDPLLDPHFNPNIHVEDSVNVAQDAAKVMDKVNGMPLEDANKHILPR